MDKKQLLALFAISLAISTVGSSMGALLQLMPSGWEPTRMESACIWQEYISGWPAVF